MTATMAALVCTGLDGPGDMVLQHVPRPSLKSGGVLIEAHAWGVNYADALMTRGKYQTRPEPPFIAGCELSGTVIDVADDVHGVEVGARVAALAPGGGFAEIVPADAYRVLPLSSHAEFATGAGFFSGYATAMHGLRQRAQLKAGETLLVLAAGGGTGLAAVDVGIALGAKVIAVAGSERKLTSAAAHGAQTIDYSRCDVGEEIRRMTGGEGVDVVFDPVGGDLFDRVCRRVRWNGRYLVVGFASGRIPSFPVNLCLVKGFSLVGVFADDFMRKEPAASLANARMLNDLLEQGRLSPQIKVVEGLRNIPKLLEDIEHGSLIGKVVVRR